MDDPTENLLMSVPKSLLLQFMSSLLLQGVANVPMSELGYYGSENVAAAPVRLLLLEVQELQPIITWLNTQRNLKTQHPSLGICYKFLDDLRLRSMIPKNQLRILRHPHRCKCDFSSSWEIEFQINVKEKIIL
jgi:hypothetical protein